MTNVTRERRRFLQTLRLPVPICSTCSYAATVAAIDAGKALFTAVDVAREIERRAEPDRHNATVTVPMFYARAKVALNARKPRMAGRGDAPTTTHAARSTGTVYGTADRAAVQAYAAQAKYNRR